MTPSPVVRLNHAVAVAMVDGAAAGLALLEELDAAGDLAGYHLLHAAQADLLRRLGRHRGRPWHVTARRSSLPGQMPTGRT